MRYNYDPNDGYDLGNRDYMPVQISVKTSDQNITIELPWDATADQYVHAFYTAMIGTTFISETAIEAFYNFGKERIELEKEEEEEE